MKIAIVGSFDYHLECIGFLLEIYNNNDNNIDIIIGKDSDKHGYIKYYLTIFNFNVIYNKKKRFDKGIINNYDKIFKLTSNDSCLNHNKIISILHLDSSIVKKKDKSEKFISLTPYIQGNNVYTIFPIYHPVLTGSKVSNNVIMIGYYDNNWFDNDTINFITNNINHQFIFVVWGSNSYPKLNNLKNVKLLMNIKTCVLNNMINDSKFILSKKIINHDRFSGQLALAMSYEKPLIIDTKTKNTYKLPGIGFDKNYSEVGNLDEISDEKYNFLKNEIKSLKNTIIDANKKIFESVF